MAISKLSKSVLQIFLGIFITISLIIGFAIYVINNPYIDSSEISKCEDNPFVANGERIFIVFDSLEKNMDLKKIVFYLKDTNNKIIYYKVNEKDNYHYYFDNKILKTDTLIIKTKNKEYIISGFKTISESVKAGKDRGKVYCHLELKINNYTFSTENLNTIYLDKKNE